MDRTSHAPSRDRVIRQHLGLARRLASRYSGRDIAVEDLRQVACLGLVKAADRYDPDRGTSFSKFAVSTVRGELRRYFRDHGWMVRPPRWIQELQAHASRAEGPLTQQLGRSPRLEELAAAADTTPDRLREARAAEGCFVPTSLDAIPVSAERLAEPVDEIEELVDRIALRAALGRLRRRDRKILAMRFEEELTQQQIGKRIGVTQMQVSRLLSRILGDLRRDLLGDDLAVAAAG